MHLLKQGKQRGFILGTIIILSGIMLLGQLTFKDNSLRLGRSVQAAANIKYGQARPTVNFSQKNPASVKPIITWSKVSGAVAYEFELFKETAKGKELMPCFATKQIYVNGYNADLSEYKNQAYLYWRVRGLNLEGKPIGEFSDFTKLYIDKNKKIIQRPMPTSIFRQSRGAELLYPVFAWIPIAGAVQYEVEILRNLPENPQGIKASRYRIAAAMATGFDYYDEVPRIADKTLYWRVRGLDETGSPIGGYSAAAPFNINFNHQVTVATYGDSITHGGGSISYSPADWEYSYQHYLDFPTINLARSGDTSRDMVERFDNDVVPFRPQYLLILAGTNSLRGDVTAQSVIDDLIILREKCLAYHIKAIFLTIPPLNPKNIQRAFQQDTAFDWREKIGQVNEFIRSQEHIDIAPLLTDNEGLLPESLAIDGLHPDVAGKKLIAKAINEQWWQVKF